MNVLGKVQAIYSVEDENSEKMVLTYAGKTLKIDIAMSPTALHNIAVFVKFAQLLIAKRVNVQSLPYPLVHEHKSATFGPRPFVSS